MDRDEWTLNMKRYRLLWPKNPPKAEVDDAWYELVASYSYSEMDKAMSQLAKFKPFSPSVQELLEEAEEIARATRPKRGTVLLDQGYPTEPTAYGKAWLRFVPVLGAALRAGVVGRKYTEELAARQAKQLAAAHGVGTEAMVQEVEADRRILRAKLVAAGVAQSEAQV